MPPCPDQAAQWDPRWPKQLLLMAVNPFLKWLSDINGLLLGPVIEKVRLRGPLLSTQEAQRQTAGPECHFGAYPYRRLWMTSLTASSGSRTILGFLSGMYARSSWCLSEPLCSMTIRLVCVYICIYIRNVSKTEYSCGSEWMETYTKLRHVTQFPVRFFIDVF